MEPYKAKKLPFEFEITNEILNLLCEAKEAYGEYKGYLKNMSYDYKCFLENAFINDIFYSFKIDNAKIEKDNMFYMSYMNKSNTSILYNNIKKSLLIGLTSSNKIGFSLETFNKINKTLLNGLKKDNSTKRSGHLRKTQTYLLKPGIAGSSVSFVPPVHTELNSLMKIVIRSFIKAKNMNKFETLTYEELSAVFGGNGGKARRRRKITNCAKAIGMGALKDGLKYGIAGTAFGTPIGTVGGAIFGANVGIISGSVSCVSHL